MPVYVEEEMDKLLRHIWKICQVYQKIIQFYLSHYANNYCFRLAGIPPLAGFFAKFYIFMTVIEQSMYFLAIVGLTINCHIAAFYYLRIIKVIYFDPDLKKNMITDHHLGLKITLISLATVCYY